MTTSPLLGPYQQHNPIAWHHGKAMSTQTLLSHIRSVGNQLPDKKYTINMCQDRYAFLVGFAAALTHNQTTLLPPNQSPEVLQQLIREYPDCYLLTDESIQIEGIEDVSVQIDALPHQAPIENPDILDAQIAAIAFTSGTTGMPRPNFKSWGSMVQVAKKTAQRVSFSNQDSMTVVATVPHQHMYGLETSIMLPLQQGWSFHSGRPFFPEDIAAALHQHPSNRMLVSTPIHLRACVKAETTFPHVQYVLSATAPLPKPLAQEVETLLQTKMVEIYGFAEAGTIATRQPVQENHWTLLSELTLVKDNEGYALRAPYFSSAVPIPDTIQATNPHQFTLKGRPNHLINIGGHRASLDDLNIKLLSIDGILDGTFYMPEDEKESVTRLIAFVVAPEKNTESILTVLRTKIAPVFLPRPIYLVDRLPRNHTGKLLKDDVEKLILAHKSHTTLPNG